MFSVPRCSLLCLCRYCKIQKLMTFITFTISSLWGSYIRGVVTFGSKKRYIKLVRLSSFFRNKRWKFIKTVVKKWDEIHHSSFVLLPHVVTASLIIKCLNYCDQVTQVTFTWLLVAKINWYYRTLVLLLFLKEGGGGGVRYIQDLLAATSFLFFMLLSKGCYFQGVVTFKILW